MRCQRCQGCMIEDTCMDLRDDTGRIAFDAWRCVNCGEIIDAVVLTHRARKPAEPYRGRTRDRRLWERLVAA